MIDRRAFLESGTKLIIGALSLGTARIVQSQPPQLRKSINGLNADDPLVKNYAKAVALMKGLPSDDPRNWRQQANIHNNYCPHNNWWFLPWHRAYLYYFENICRDVLQDSSFNLPYWDWTSLPKIPGPFLDSRSSLWDDGRAKNGMIQLGDEIVGTRVISDIVGSSALVDLFSSPTTTDEQREDATAGALEFTPHNGVHSTVLGDMANFLSPLDPIFWLHHCNVDRIWASWSKLNSNVAPSANLWKNHALIRFYDPGTKQQVSPAAADTLDATKYRAIYDHYATRSAPSSFPSTRALQSTMIGVAGNVANTEGVRQVEASTLAGKDISLGVAQQFRVPVSASFSSFVRKEMSLSASEGFRNGVTYLQIEKVSRPTIPSTAFRVFLNCKNPTLNTPLDDPTYVTTVAFFSGDHGASSHPDITFTLNVTAALARVVQAGIYSAGVPIDVAILPVDLSNPQRSSPTEVLKPGSVRFVGLETM
jgi:tyrosinase